MAALSIRWNHTGKVTRSVSTCGSAVRPVGIRHVGSGGTHRDDSDTLWLDGKESEPAP
ncbi:hypothetical protein GCM10025788_10490 [Serinicoccus chungangensis]